MILTIKEGMHVGVPATLWCVLFGNFGKNKFIPWHAILGVIAGKDHSLSPDIVTTELSVACAKLTLL
jgi:hypothetical protein